MAARGATFHWGYGSGVFTNRACACNLLFGHCANAAHVVDIRTRPPCSCCTPRRSGARRRGRELRRRGGGAEGAPAKGARRGTASHLHLREPPPIALGGGKLLGTAMAKSLKAHENEYWGMTADDKGVCKLNRTWKVETKNIQRRITSPPVKQNILAALCQAGAEYKRGRPPAGGVDREQQAWQNAPTSYGRRAASQATRAMSGAGGGSPPRARASSVGLNAISPPVPRRRSALDMSKRTEAAHGPAYRCWPRRSEDRSEGAPARAQGVVARSQTRMCGSM